MQKLGEKHCEWLKYAAWKKILFKTTKKKCHFTSFACSSTLVVISMNHHDRKAWISMAHVAFFLLQRYASVILSACRLLSSWSCCVVAVIDGAYLVVFHCSCALLASFWVSEKENREKHVSASVLQKFIIWVRTETETRHKHDITEIVQCQSRLRSLWY
jgi:hypothetical protein